MFEFLSRLGAFVLSLVLVVGLWAGLPTAAQAAKLAQPPLLVASKGLANYPAAFQLAAVATEAVVDDEAVESAEKEAKEAAKAAAKEAKKAAKAEAKKLKLAAKAEEKKLKEAKEAEEEAAKAEAKKLKLAAKEEAKKLKAAKEAEATAKATVPAEDAKAS
ncbi:hypothetical protein [Altericista sp. CCNU0014]|uniref:hypothetical protein n=1 Tax=Altericista sp. CCNU0014 TaxID=3082949 RepID=UPI00384E9FBF